MLTFKQLREEYAILLTEDRIDFLKQQYKDGISTEHDPEAKTKESDKIIDHFASKADPTKGKTHTNWLLNQYRRGTIKQSDAPALKSTLTDFEKVKGKLEKNDINAYKTVDDLRDAVATQKPHVEAAAKEKKVSDEKRNAGMEKMYDQDGVTGFKVPNKEVSIKNYGPSGKLCNARWCTSAAGSRNMWDRYDGGKYTMHFPNGSVLQLHHQSNQLKDPSNTEIQENDSRYAPYAKHIHDFIKQTAKNEGLDHTTSKLADRFHVHSPEEIDTAIEKYKNSERGRQDKVDFHGMISKAPMNKEQLKKVRELDDKSEGDRHWGTVTSHLMNNPNIGSDEIDKTYKDHVAAGREEHVLDDVAYKNPNLKGETLNKVFAKTMGPNGTYAGQRGLTQNPNLTDAHVQHIMTHKPNMVTGLVNNHAIKLSKDAQEKVKDVARSDDYRLASRPDVHPDVVNRMVSGEVTVGGVGMQRDVINRLIANPNIKLNKDQIDKITKHSAVDADTLSHLFDSHHADDEDRNKIVDKMVEHKFHPSDDMMESKKMTSEHLDKFKDELPNVVARHPKATPEHINDVIEKHGDDQLTQDRLLTNKKAVKPEHLKALAGKIKPANWDSFLQHPSVNAGVLHHVYDNTDNVGVKGAILHHPSVQASHFEKAMKEDGMKLHGAISNSVSAPPSALHKMADSPLQYVRMNVVKNKNTGQDTLKKLAASSDPDVATAAAKKVKGK